MQTFERIKSKFEEQGQPGIPEEKAAKSINRWRASGVWGRNALAAVGVLSILGGIRHGEGGMEDKIASGIAAPIDEAFEVTRNSQGNYDIPFIDIMGGISDGEVRIGADFNNNTSQSTGNCVLGESVIEPGSNPLAFIGDVTGNNNLSAEEDVYRSMTDEARESLNSIFADPNSIGEVVELRIC